LFNELNSKEFNEFVYTIGKYAEKEMGKKIEGEYKLKLLINMLILISSYDKEELEDAMNLFKINPQYHDILLCSK